MTDRELLRLIAQKDPTAFREFYDRYSRPLYAYLCRVLRDPHGAEDVLSEVMFAVWREAWRFRGDSHPRTWLYRIARNRAVEWLRARPQAEIPLDGPVDAEAPDEEARAALRVTLEQALRDLPQDQRDVVQLAFVAGLPYREIAELLSCPENTVKTRMFWAKRKLRAALRADAGALEEGQG
jgi:RNA polymerase sigma-70 factor (ECF subfamily)